MRRFIPELVAELEQRDLLMLARKVAARHAVTLDEMLGPRREPAGVRARQEFWSELHDMGCFTYVRLGRLVGRDRATVMEGIAAHRVRKQRTEAAA